MEVCAKGFDFSLNRQNVRNEPRGGSAPGTDVGRHPLAQAGPGRPRHGYPPTHIKGFDLEYFCINSNFMKAFRKKEI